MTLLGGKHAFITGASRGIGAVVAHHLEDAGASVTRTALHARVNVMACDVASVEQVAAAMTAAEQRHGPIDILINNAGIGGSNLFSRTDLAMLERMFDINFKGAWHCSQRALPAMTRAKWGRIINIASMAGLDGYPYITAYCASKHALIGFTRALAAEMAVRSSDVGVAAICPGYTETDMLDDSIANIVRQSTLSKDEARAALSASNPGNRIVTPEEIASAVVTLCTSPSSRINGQIISIPALP